MRPQLSISAKVFLGFAVVLATFGMVSVFGALQMHRIGEGLALVSQTYHPLTRLGAQLDSSYRNSEEATTRLLDEPDTRTRQALLHLALDYHPRAAREKVRSAKKVLADARALASAIDERPFLDRLDGLLDAVEVRYGAYTQAGERVKLVLRRVDGAPPDARVLIAPDLDSAMRRLKELEGGIGGSLAAFTKELEQRINLRVRESSREERRTALLTAIFSILAIGVGLFVTALSQRTLAPIRRLTEAVKEVGEGRFEVEIGPGAADELGLLAREFNEMQKKLGERERLLAEKSGELLRSERLAAVGKLAAQITHEIRNPLSSLALNAELLSEQLGDGIESAEDKAEAQSIVRAMDREIDRLTEVTEEYLRFSRLPKPSMQPSDLNEVVEDLRDFVNPELASAGVEFTMDLSKELPPVQADPSQLRQVLLNLVRNAREAVGARGTVKVTTRYDDTRQAALISVDDNGPGIEPQMQGRLFEPFFSTKEKGTGLGLALVQQIVAEHGGEIRCETSGDGGARFVVVLPQQGPRSSSDPHDGFVGEGATTLVHSSS